MYLYSKAYLLLTAESNSFNNGQQTSNKQSQTTIFVPICDLFSFQYFVKFRPESIFLL